MLLYRNANKLVRETSPSLGPSCLACMQRARAVVTAKPRIEDRNLCSEATSCGGVAVRHGLAGTPTRSSWLPWNLTARMTGHHLRNSLIPVVQRGLGHDHHVRPVDAPELVQVAQQADRLQRLPQALRERRGLFSQRCDAVPDGAHAGAAQLRHAAHEHECFGPHSGKQGTQRHMAMAWSSPWVPEGQGQGAGCAARAEGAGVRAPSRRRGCR